jgi:predicted nucleic acid-binding protein
MNLVDSSGWLEFFSDGPNASFFAPPIQKLSELIVPTVSLYEVFKRVLQQRDETQALQAVALMEQAMVVELDAAIAFSAAKLSVDLKLPIADSIILASARAFDAMLWSQDAEFEGIEGVRFVRAP